MKITSVDTMLFSRLHEPERQWISSTFRVIKADGVVVMVKTDDGLTGTGESYRIAEMADHYGVDLCPHSWHNGLMAMENAHLVAALPHPRVLEVCMHQGPLQWGMLARPPAIQAGWLLLPERPGLGVELAPDAPQRYPFIEGHYAINVER